MGGIVGVIEASTVSLTLILLVIMDLINLVSLVVKGGVKNLYVGVLDKVSSTAVTFSGELTIITSRIVIYQIVVLVNNI